MRWGCEPDGAEGKQKEGDLWLHAALTMCRGGYWGGGGCCGWVGGSISKNRPSQP